MISAKVFGFCRICCRGGWQSSRQQSDKIFLRTVTAYRVMSSQIQGEEIDDSRRSEEKKEQKSPLGMYLSNLKSVNLHLTEDSTPYCAKVIHPGFMPGSFGFHGHPSLPSVLLTATAARVYAMHVPADDSGRSFFEYNKLTSNCYTFISSSLVKISAHMYDISVPKWPLEVKLQGGHIGRTSLSTVSSMTSPADPERRELMSQISQVVMVDKVTRRPTPIEDKWRNLYQHHCVRGEPLIIQRQDVPDSGPLSVYEVKIAWSDTDNYKHTNFASYPRFAVDAVHDALRLGKLQGKISEAEISSGVALAKMAFLGESEEGDVLTVKVWCPESLQRTVVCSMEKGGQVVNQVTLTFHSVASEL